MNWVETGRFLVIAGVAILVLGLVFMLGDKLPIGRLPGDIHLGNDRFRIVVPVATCLLLSAILTLVVNFFSRR